MGKLTMPTYIYSSVDAIPFDVLKKHNIKGIMFDLDNTLADYSGKISNYKIEWIKKAKEKGIKICILSNSRRQVKIKNIMENLDIEGLSYAMKPMLKGYIKALALLGLPKENVCMIGDQIFTDVMGANRFGIMSILVKPVGTFEELWVKIKRPFERIIINKYYRKINKSKG